MVAEYINREDVIEKLTGVFQLQAETAKAIVDAIPAADVVERKKGKWIGGELGHCSCCGNEGCFSDIWPDGQERYCPYCGADMREEPADV